MPFIDSEREFVVAAESISTPTALYDQLRASLSATNDERSRGDVLTEHFVNTVGAWASSRVMSAGAAAKVFYSVAAEALRCGTADAAALLNAALVSSWFSANVADQGAASEEDERTVVPLSWQRAQAAIVTLFDAGADDASLGLCSPPWPTTAALVSSTSASVECLSAHLSPLVLQMVHQASNATTWNDAVMSVFRQMRRHRCGHVVAVESFSWAAWSALWRILLLNFANVTPTPGPRERLAEFLSRYGEVVALAKTTSSVVEPEARLSCMLRELNAHAVADVASVCHTLPSVVVGAVEQVACLSLFENVPQEQLSVKTQFHVRLRALITLQLQLLSDCSGGDIRGLAEAIDGAWASFPLLLQLLLPLANKPAPTEDMQRQLYLAVVHVCVQVGLEWIALDIDAAGRAFREEALRILIGVALRLLARLCSSALALELSVLGLLEGVQHRLVLDGRGPCAANLPGDSRSRTRVLVEMQLLQQASAHLGCQQRSAAGAAAVAAPSLFHRWKKLLEQAVWNAAFKLPAASTPVVGCELTVSTWQDALVGCFSRETLRGPFAPTPELNFFWCPPPVAYAANCPTAESVVLLSSGCRSMGSVADFVQAAAKQRFEFQRAQWKKHSWEVAAEPRKLCWAWDLTTVDLVIDASVACRLTMTQYIVLYFTLLTNAHLGAPGVGSATTHPPLHHKSALSTVDVPRVVSAIMRIGGDGAGRVDDSITALVDSCLKSLEDVLQAIAAPQHDRLLRLLGASCRSFEDRLAANLLLAVESDAAGTVRNNKNTGSHLGLSTARAPTRVSKTAGLRAEAFLCRQAKQAGDQGVRPTDLLDAYVFYVRSTVTAPQSAHMNRDRVVAAAQQDPLLQTLIEGPQTDDELRTIAQAELSAAAASLVQKGLVEIHAPSGQSPSLSIAASRLTFVPA